jgi:hypothetical protein
VAEAAAEVTADIAADVGMVVPGSAFTAGLLVALGVFVPVGVAFGIVLD